MEENGSPPYEDCFEDTGDMEPLADSDMTLLFRDLERELEAVIHRYHVPPTDLNKLFQVVQGMFETMDASREAYEQLEGQKEELELLWKQEKDKLRATQMKKLELECRLEEERMRVEGEKSQLEVATVTLQTRLKQVAEHKDNVEQELHRLKEKTSQDEAARTDLLEQYKKQYDIMKKTQTLRRMGSVRSMKRRTLPPLALPPSSKPAGSATPPQIDDVTTSGVPSPDTDHSTTSPLILEAPQVVLNGRHPSPLPPSLAEELQQQQQVYPAPADSESEGEGEWGSSLEYGSDMDDDDLLCDELMKMELFAPAKAELAMLQKEQASWREEGRRVEGERDGLRLQKEAMESRVAQLQLEVRTLRDSKAELQRELTEVKNERNEILDNYLEQPYDEYCITKKELHDLLKRHQSTAIALEHEKLEKERFKERMRKAFSRSRHQSLSDKPDSFDDKSSPPSLLLSPPSPPPSSVRLTRTFTAAVREGGSFLVNRGWLLAQDSLVTSRDLPLWAGQVTLKGVETDGIECVALGRVYHSSIELPPSLMSPAHHREGGGVEVTGLQQLHAEVWVVSSEAGLLYIEIIDILARPPKIKQHFVLKPHPQSVVCMRAFPGAVEEGRGGRGETDPLWNSSDSLYASYIPGAGRRTSDVTPFMKARPSSAPQRGRGFSWKGRGGDQVISEEEAVVAADRSDLLEPVKMPANFSIATTNGNLSGNVSSLVTSSLSSPLTPGGRRRGEGVSLTPPMSKRIHFSPRHSTPVRGECGSWQHSTPATGDMWSDSDLARSEEPGLSSGCGEGRGQELEDSIPGFKVEEFPGAGQTTPPPPRRLGRRSSSSSQQHPVMWVATKQNKLVFYPTTFPCHKPLACVQLQHRVLCMEYVAGKVFVGHTDSVVSVYHIDEFSGGWDIDNPERVLLPSHDPNQQFEVRCLAAVGDRVWVGAGPSLFILDADTLSREGSVFLDGCRKNPDKILPVGGVVLVATEGSALFVYDAKSARLLRKFDVYPVTQLLDECVEKRPDISSLVSDGSVVYVGTSDGKLVAIPLDSITKDCHENEHRTINPSSPAVTSLTSSASQQAELDDYSEPAGTFQSQSSVALHSHRDTRVTTLLHIPLPHGKHVTLNTETRDAMRFHSLPNLTSPLGRLPISYPLYKSLVVSAGKGHVEYSELPPVEVDLDSSENGSVLYERSEAFQLLLWGHRNKLS